MEVVKCSSLLSSALSLVYVVGPSVIVRKVALEHKL